MEFRLSALFLIPVMASLLQVKCQNLQDNCPFDKHGAIMSIFIVATYVHVKTFCMILRPIPNTNYLPLIKFICHMWGGLAQGLLLLILVPPFGWFILTSWALQFPFYTSSHISRPLSFFIVHPSQHSESYVTHSKLFVTSSIYPF